jgi:hypothetical protein
VPTYICPRSTRYFSPLPQDQSTHPRYSLINRQRKFLQFVALCFQSLAKCPICKSFVLIFMQIGGGCTPLCPSEHSTCNLPTCKHALPIPFISLHLQMPILQPLCFQIIANCLGGCTPSSPISIFPFPFSGRSASGTLLRSQQEQDAGETPALQNGREQRQEPFSG